MQHKLLLLKKKQSKVERTNLKDDISNFEQKLKKNLSNLCILINYQIVLIYKYTKMMMT